MSLAMPERNAEIWRRYQAGETLAELGVAYGVSTARIQQIVTSARRTGGYEKLQEWRDDLVRTMQDNAVALVEIRDAPLPTAHANNGAALFDPETGEVVRDVTPRIAAIDRLGQYQRDLAKLLGLNAPDKAVVDSTLHYIVEGVDTDKMK